MANITSFPVLLAIKGDGSSLSATVALASTPTSVSLVSAFASDGTDVSSNVASVVVSGPSIVFTFNVAFTGLITVEVALTSAFFSNIPAQSVVQATSPWTVGGNIAISNFPVSQVVTLTSTTIAGSVAVTGTFWQATQPVSGTFWQATQPISGTVAVTQATGTNLHAVVDSGTITAVTAITNALPAGANIIGKVDILGNAGAILDAVITAATAPANALAILHVNQTTAPSLTVGQSVAAQCDYVGNLFVKPYRRSQSVSVSGTIASTSAATLLAAQAAGIFADLSSLVLTVTAVSNMAVSTVNISDGTTTYKFATASNQTGTGTSAVSEGFAPFTMSWPVPISAANAATAWTIALNAANCTVSYVATFVLQKAS